MAGAALTARRAVPWPAAPLAALLSLAAGYVHLAYVQSHWEEWWAYGAFFLAVGIAQALYAIALLRWPGTLLALAGIAANLAVVAMYVTSRVQAVPMGPHAGVKERAGVVDLTTTAAEIVLVAALLTMLPARPRRRILDAMVVAALGVWVLRLSQGGG